MQDIDNQRQEIENADGPLDSDAIQQLKDEKRQLETEHKAKRKELNELAKTANQRRKLQQELNTTASTQRGDRTPHRRTQGKKRR